MTALDTALHDAALARTVPVFILLAARVLPLAWLVPTTTSMPASWLARSVIGVALGVSLLPLALVTPHPTLGLGAALLPALLAELLRGFLFAVAVCLPLHAFAWTGQLAERVRGTTAGALDDNLDAPLSMLYRYGAIAVLLGSGAHLLMLDAFADGLSRFPLGSVPELSSAPNVLHSMVALVSRALSLSLSLCAPVFLCVLVLSLVLGLLSRVSAPLAAPLLGGPLVPLAALGVVCVLVALTLPEAETALRVFLRQATHVLSALG